MQLRRRRHATGARIQRFTARLHRLYEQQKRAPEGALRPTWIGIKRDLLDDALVPLNADLDQNSDPEVAQRGRYLDA